MSSLEQAAVNTCVRVFILGPISILTVINSLAIRYYALVSIGELPVSCARE